MDVQHGALGGLDSHVHPHALMVSASGDQSMLSPRLPHGRLSRSHESEWEKIMKQFDNGSNNSNASFDLFGLSAGPSTTLQQTPMRSIESVTAFGSEPIHATHTGGLPSPALVPLSHAQQQRFWPGPHVAAQHNPDTLTADQQWSVTQSLDQTLVPNELMAFEGAGFQQNPQVIHQAAGANPLLHEASPHLYFDDSMNDGWDQGDARPLYTDGSGSDELNDVDGDAADPCYAQLLYRCLKESPGHAMSLKDLYEWVKEHSQKAKDQKNRGWQNSVRHNLSMNAAFERVPPSQAHGVKKGSLWRLTQSALRDGVISTTRYRKDPKRKSERRGSPALKRQISGAKGGQATRNAQRRQQALQQARSFPNFSALERHRRQQTWQGGGFLSPTPMRSMPSSPQPGMLTPEAPVSPYFVDYDEAHGAVVGLSAPISLPEVQSLYAAPAKSTLHDFEFSHIDFTNGGLIGDHDDFAPETPTEASFTSCDESMPALLSHTTSREATSFPVDV